MCGIFGIINNNKYNVNKKYFKELRCILEHRGPDAWQEVHEEKFSFAHSRLKIIDTSSLANQPFYDCEKKIFLTYNGEIYNYKEIRKILKKKGYHFSTNSDTEVIVYAYKEWGISFLKYLEGMFALALYDKSKNKCYLIRDRLGIKPLFYYYDKERVIFSSQVSAITSFPGFKKELNKFSVSSFLSYRHILGNKTMFKGILQIPPGGYAEINNINVDIKIYWDIVKKDFNNLSVLKAFIKRSVKSHLQSDVPIGLFLSGGIDSSILIKEMSAITSKKLRRIQDFFMKASTMKVFMQNIWPKNVMQS